MAQISVSLPSDGSTAEVAQYNTPITTIVNEVNGGLDNSNIKPNAAIAGSKLADGAVIPNKTDFGALNHYVSSLHSTTSTSYTDLSSNGPEVTVDVPASGKVMVMWTVEMYNSTVGASSYAGINVSGANTIAPSDERTIRHRQSIVAGGTGYALRMGANRLFTGLTPGPTTFKIQYRVTGGTGSFTNRELAVIPIS